MLVQGLEYRSRLVSATSVVAIFHDGHHRDPGALARWYIMMSSRLVLKSHELCQQMVKPSPQRR